MTLGELAVTAKGARAKGHTWLQLVVVRKAKPRTKRIRLMPGLYADVVGPLSEHRYLIDVLLSDVESLLAKMKDAGRT